MPIALYVYGNIDDLPIGYTEINPINTKGVVQPKAIQGPQTGAGPRQEILVTISGAHYLYVSNPHFTGTNDVISCYSVNGSTVTSLGQVTAAGNLGAQAEMVYINGTLFVPLDSGAISSYAVNSNGSLTLKSAAAYTVANGTPLAMAGDATGKYLIVGEYASLTTWNALSLAVGGGGTLSLANQQSGISGTVSYLYANPSETHGDYLYGSVEAAFYEVSVSSGGVVSVTTDSSIIPNTGTITTPAWIDPTGTWLFLAEDNTGTLAESLVQYRINTDGSLTAGSMPPIQIATGNGSVVGGITSSPGFYDSTNGMVVIPVGGYLTTYTYNSLNGDLTSLSLDTGDAPGGIMAAYAP